MFLTPFFRFGVQQEIDQSFIFNQNGHSEWSQRFI